MAKHFIAGGTMKTLQWTVRLAPRNRGFHLVTDEVLKQTEGIRGMQAGICHIHIKHTSAGLTLNENADPDVRTDFEQIFNRIVPENQPYYVHTLEGPDDMPAHVKSSLVGASVSVPVSNGRFNLGTWQGIYLCEFRNRAGSRALVVTAIGE
ncbi:MAG: secondary thiamine-phosphate synthase enzyme YjbQ [Spirochaetales bacterium]